MLEDAEETYHFIGYVPANGKVWELDGLKAGPIEVGELPEAAQDSSSTLLLETWMDIVRPALRMKMKKYGGAAESAQDIRFNLLALVDDRYQVASDELELLKREKTAIERRLGDDDPFSSGWKDTVGASVLASSKDAFVTSVRSALPGSVYALDFGSQMLQKQKSILDLPVERLTAAWENCVESALRAKVAVEDELSKATAAETDRIARVHDYEPFFKAFITQLHDEGRLNQSLHRDDNGLPLRAIKASQKKKT
ncbi:hypothetical protein BV25DRAFT_1108322 [Artomyces pyxidatus]|uniref:Uncharacterized protein n=1 Tax=Artomyces pyxidatus TaxID=48021 RepID=A0ACB8TGE9_9AGAM|nr:hypothetical protein BV25DRAFT_1108322 [Artomyces pyxidatus]